MTRYIAGSLTKALDSMFIVRASTEILIVGTKR